MTTIYGLKTCDTCRKAIKALPGAAFVDIRSAADLPARIPQWLEAVGKEKLVNTKSATFRALTDADREKAKAGDIATLIAHPALIKRPLIEDGDAVTVGWPVK